MSTVDSFDMLQASHLSLYSSNFKHGIMVRSQASVPVRQGIWTTLYEGGQRTLACVEGTAEWRARREADSHRADDAHPLAGHSASEGIVEEDGFQEHPGLSSRSRMSGNDPLLTFVNIINVRL